MHGLSHLPAAYVLVGRGRLVLNLLTQGLRVLVSRGRRVERIGDAVLLGLAEVIDQQVAGDRRNPGDERSLRAVIARQRPVHLDEDFLGQVFGVVGRSGEAVADVVDAPVVGLNDFFPGSGVAGNTAADQHRNYLNVFQPCAPWEFTRYVFVRLVSGHAFRHAVTAATHHSGPYKTVRGCTPVSSRLEQRAPASNRKQGIVAAPESKPAPPSRDHISSPSANKKWRTEVRH